jgi:hypothetical protein
VLLVRADLAERVGNPRNGHCTAQFSEPFLIGPATSTRGWISIDYRPEPTTPVRIFSTHLEVADPVTGGAQERQGDEILAMLAASPYPVVALGDFNAPADGALAPTGIRRRSPPPLWASHHFGVTARVNVPAM